MTTFSKQTCTDVVSILRACLFAHIDIQGGSPNGHVHHQTRLCFFVFAHNRVHAYYRKGVFLLRCMLFISAVTTRTLQDALCNITLVRVHTCQLRIVDGYPIRIPYESLPGVFSYRGYAQRPCTPFLVSYVHCVINIHKNICNIGNSTPRGCSVF